MTHIWVSKITIIGSDNGLSSDQRQAIIWTIAGILLIGLLGINFSEILIEIPTFSFKKVSLKVSSAKRRPFCLGLIESTLHLKFKQAISIDSSWHWNPTASWHSSLRKKNACSLNINLFLFFLLKYISVVSILTCCNNPDSFSNKQASIVTFWNHTSYNWWLK